MEAKKQSTDRLIEAKNKSPSFNSGFTGKGRKEQRNDKDWGEQRERRKVVSAEYYIVHRQPTLSKWRARYGFCARSFVDFCVAQFCGILRRAVLWISAPRSFVDFCAALLLKAECSASRHSALGCCVPVHWCGGFSPCTLQGLLSPSSSSTIPTKHYTVHTLHSDYCNATVCTLEGRAAPISSTLHNKTIHTPPSMATQHSPKAAYCCRCKCIVKKIPPLSVA